jgi:hypothetical protein
LPGQTSAGSGKRKSETCVSLEPNRTLRKLEADKLIERRSARAIVIGNWKKLAAAADFNSTISTCAKTMLLWHDPS